MPLDGGVSAMFTNEYYRFWQGVRDLDPDTRAAWAVAQGRKGLKPGETPTITLPGWDDVIQLGPRYQITRAETAEFYAALRAGRAPNISKDAERAILSRAAYFESVRTSAAPDWLRGWGQILTALDNVQDFVSTAATLGRFAVWLLPRAGARFVPGLGWIVLASDLLNLLSFLGILAVPAYALLCHGPRGALAAGVPGFLFKRALKGEVWKLAAANPFGRAARLSALTRAAGRLPGFSNLIEVAQTTQSLWGYGLSLGGLVGASFEASFAIERASRGEATRINAQPLTDSFSQLYGDALKRLTPGELHTLQQAAGVLAGAPMLQRVQDFLSDSDHLLTLLALQSAIPLLARFANGQDWQSVFAEAAPGDWSPVLGFGPVSSVILAEQGQLDLAPTRWALPGNPATLAGDDYLQLVAPAVIGATTDYLHARRNTPGGVLAGTLISMTCEHVWKFLTGDDHAIRWELSTDARLLASLSEEGYLVNVADPEAQIWRFWLDARRALELDGGTRLAGAVWCQLAARHGLTLIRLLPPEAPWPPEWDAFRDSEGALPLVSP